MTDETRYQPRDIGFYPTERTIVIIHGPNFYNAHRALGLSSANYLSLRKFFEDNCDLISISYFNAAPNDCESPVERLGKFLDYNRFKVHMKFVDLIQPTNFEPPPPAEATIIYERMDQPEITRLGSTGQMRDRLMASKPPISFPQQASQRPMSDVPRMPRVFLAMDIMADLIKTLMLVKTRHPIQRVVFIGGETEYGTAFELLSEIGVKLTIFGLNKDSVGVNNQPIPPYVMLPYAFKTGHAARFVDLSVLRDVIEDTQAEQRKRNQREDAPRRYA